MGAEAIATLVGAAVAVLTGTIAGVWALGHRHEKTEITRIEMGHSARFARLEEKLTAEQTRAQGLTTELEQIRHQHKSLLSGRTGVVLKTEIDHEVVQAMPVLSATAASVLIQAPPPNDQTSMVFLSAYGPVANRIRNDLIAVENSKAGKVFKSGLLDNSRDPRHDPDWNPTVDAKAEAETQTLLTVPVKLRDGPGRALAVCQFLNKRDGKAFSQQDERVAQQVAQRIASLVHEFLSDDRNYEVIGIPLDQPHQEASVMFCDLTASTDLLKTMNTPSALLRLDEYLESLGEIALAHGAKLVTSLGDGMLLSFNVPKPLDDHVQHAVDAAWAMQRDFVRIWRSWQLYDLKHLHNRISIATGPVILASVGPKQYRQETIVGPVVNYANKLCQIAPRDQDVIVVDDEVAKRVAGYRLEELTIPDTAAGRVPSRMLRVAGLA